MPRNEEYLRTVLKSQAKPLLRIGWSGGGTKGIAMPGAYRALLDAGLMDGIKEVTGTSAGAMMAMFVAIGLPIETIREKLLYTDMMPLIRDRNIHSNVEGAVRHVSIDGKEMVKFLDDTINVHIRDFLQKIEDVNKVPGKPDDKNSLAILKTKMTKKDAIFTFADLQVLHTIFPKRFKYLTTTMVRHNDGALILCNPKNTPGLGIANAIRASMAIPLIFSPSILELDGSEANVNTPSYIDGGVALNFPDCFDDLSHPEQTLMFAFAASTKLGPNASDDRVSYAIHYGHWQEAITSETLNKLGSALFKAIAESTEFSLSTNTLLDVKFKKFVKSKIYDALSEQVQNETILPRVVKKLEAMIWAAFKAKFSQLRNPIRTEADRVNVLTKAILDQFTLPKTSIHKPSFFERITQDYVPKHTTGFKHYKITENGRTDALKMNQTFPFRTVPLHAAMGSLAFSIDTDQRRMMDAIGYADTMAYLINYGLTDEREEGVDSEKKAHFDVASYCADVSSIFHIIYKGIVDGAGTSDKFLEKRQLYNRDINWFQKIKEHAVKHPNSATAFAFSRAIEYKSGLIKIEDLFVETYEESFRKSCIFSRSQATGETFFRHKSLKKSLCEMSEDRKKQIFTLDVPKPAHLTRMGQVREAMKHLSEMEFTPIPSPTKSPAFSTPTC